MKEEISTFLQNQKKKQWHPLLEDKKWYVSLIYLVDIFGRLNLLLQRNESNIMAFTDRLSAFVALIDLWLQKVSQKCLSMYSRLSSIIVEHNLDLDDALISLISHT